MNNSSLSNDTYVPVTRTPEKSGINAQTILLQNYLNGSLILGTIVFFVSLYSSIVSKSFLGSLLSIIFYCGLFLTTFVRTWSLRFRSYMLVFIVFGAGLLSLASNGLNPIGILFIFFSILILGILIRGNAWIFGILASVVLTSVAGVLIQTNILQRSEFFIDRNTLLYWLATLTVLIFLIYVVIAPLRRYLSLSEERIIQVDNLEKNISQENFVLSERISTLENEIDIRRSRIVASRQISREISNQSNVNTLLADTANLIQSQLGFYFAGIYLLDKKSQSIELKAASGAIGKQLLNQISTINLGDESFLSNIFSSAETKVIFDIGVNNKPVLSPLKETRSEMITPLRLEHEVLGLIDIQSEKTNAFSNEDIEIIQAIADLLAASFDRTTQITILKDQMQKLEQGYGMFTRGVWRTHLIGSKRQLKFSVQGEKISPVINSEIFKPELLQKGKTLISSEKVNEIENSTSSLMVPIKLRDQVLGAINIKCKGNNISPSLVSLVETATNRLAIALENARLLEEIQDRAEREHTIADISSKVRVSQDIDSILQTTIQELGKSLGVDEVSIKLKTPEKEK